jgi:hypothetical protein
MFIFHAKKNSPSWLTSPSEPKYEYLVFSSSLFTVQDLKVYTLSVLVDFRALQIQEKILRDFFIDPSVDLGFIDSIQFPNLVFDLCDIHLPRNVVRFDRVRVYRLGCGTIPFPWSWAGCGNVQGEG